MLLTIKDISTRLQIKPSTLYAWVAQGKIPCLRIHSLIRFKREEIEYWIESFSAIEPPAKLKATPKSPRTAPDELIARAKGQAYNPRTRGNQTEIKPHREGGA
jgi:excisionase family DNA binding protein